MKTMKTAQGTELPLLNLKGKDYLQVAHRIQWMNEEEPNFEIMNTVLQITETYTVMQSKITIFQGDTGKVKKIAIATKRENKQDFNDHTEKAETGAVGRALALLGYGTQFALADLDEGDRLADSPVTDVNNSKRASFKGSTLTTPPSNGKVTTGATNTSAAVNLAKGAVSSNGSGNAKGATSEEGWS